MSKKTSIFLQNNLNTRTIESGQRFNYQGCLISDGKISQKIVYNGILGLRNIDVHVPCIGRYSENSVLLTWYTYKYFLAQHMETLRKLVMYILWWRNWRFMPFILGVSFHTIVLEGFFKIFYMENKWQKWYIFWNRGYEGEFLDFFGQKMYLHFQICRNNTYISWV